MEADIGAVNRDVCPPKEQRGVMKELKRFLIYSGSAAAVVFFLGSLATSESTPGTLLVLLAVLLVVVLPVALIIWVGKRERARQIEKGE